jgi:hypothetical protein
MGICVKIYFYQTETMWDLRFLQRWLRRVLSSLMWHHVTWLHFTTFRRNTIKVEEWAGQTSNKYSKWKDEDIMFWNEGLKRLLHSSSPSGALLSLRQVGPRVIKSLLHCSLGVQMCQCGPLKCVVMPKIRAHQPPGLKVSSEGVIFSRHPIPWFLLWRKQQMVSCGRSRRPPPFSNAEQLAATLTWNIFQHLRSTSSADNEALTEQ